MYRVLPSEALQSRIAFLFPFSFLFLVNTILPHRVNLEGEREGVEKGKGEGEREREEGRKRERQKEKKEERIWILKSGFVSVGGRLNNNKFEFLSKIIFTGFRAGCRSS